MSWQIRYKADGDQRIQTRDFTDPEAAARFWHGVDDRHARVFALRDGKVSFGTYAEVKPVYDALERIKAAA